MPEKIKPPSCKWLGGALEPRGSAMNRTGGWVFWGAIKGEERQFRVAVSDETLAERLLRQVHPDLELTSRHSLAEPLVGLLGLKPREVAEWRAADEDVFVGPGKNPSS